jgi:threonine/homoserine/homoserine lactone efflux protein
MDLLSFIAEVEAITVSGALSPGPLTVSAAGLGIKSGKRAGLLVSLGHMAFEFPLVLLISAGLSIAQSFKQLLSIIGGAFLLYFALTQIFGESQNRCLREKWECFRRGHLTNCAQPILHNLVAHRGG